MSVSVCMLPPSGLNNCHKVWKKKDQAGDSGLNFRLKDLHLTGTDTVYVVKFMYI